MNVHVRECVCVCVSAPLPLRRHPLLHCRHLVPSTMDFYPPPRRHNPVDSICRKLQTIRRRGDREPNSPFQIPKLSSSYDSPQSGLRRNLEAILKKGERGRGMGLPSSGHPPSTRDPPTPVTYSITSTLGQRRGADGGEPKQTRTWQRCCSTPTSSQVKDSPYFTFTRGPQPVQPEGQRSTSPPLSCTFTPGNRTLSYNLNFSSAESGRSAECEPPYPALVVRRLTLGDGGRGRRRPAGGRAAFTCRGEDDACPRDSCLSYHVCVCVCVRKLPVV